MRTVVHLLEVEETFQIRGRGLILIPLLPAPEQAWNPFSDRVKITRPDGVSIDLEAQFAVTHFTMTGGRCQWATVVSLPDASREQVPMGSRVEVAEETFAKLPKAHRGEAKGCNA